MHRVVLRIVVVVVGAVVVGNLTILAMSFWARSTTGTERLVIDGVDNAAVVDERVWRGAAPTATGYEMLVSAGVTTVVDLRSDSERGPAVDALNGLDVEVVRLPIRDGQLPTEQEVARFLDVVSSAKGVVFVHCGAGVGRTGAMAAAYLAEVHGVAGRDAMRRNLAMGPPSLEQLAFAIGEGDRPPVAVTAVSRVLDAPRRIWHSLT